MPPDKELHLSDFQKDDSARPEVPPTVAPKKMARSTASPLISQVQRAAADKPKSLPAEFIGFMRTHRAWWLMPFLIALAVLALLVWSGGAAATPFVYPLF